MKPLTRQQAHRLMGGTLSEKTETEVFTNPLYNGGSSQGDNPLYQPDGD